MRKLSTLLFFLVLTSHFAVGQRKLPYPIIFVHGWIGNDATWYAMGDFLGYTLNVDLDRNNKRAGRGSIIEFNLNANNSNSNSYLNRNSGGPIYGDVSDNGSYINPNNDLFFLNFDTGGVYSNEAGAVKQGFAVGLAVRKVLEATGAKKVILVGHSMGGLAIREYLQNQSNWLTYDNQHHVAKLITIGTPHSGSNSNSGNILFYITEKGGNERSEAVRDLRYPRSYDIADRGIYLFGGKEENIVRLGLNYFNSDVNCDGYEAGSIIGLNYKPLYTDVHYTCVVGTGGAFFASQTLLTGGDDIVETSKASIFNLGYSGLSGNVLYSDKSKEESGAPNYYTKGDYTWHTKLTKQRFINLYALDEPNSANLAYELEKDRRYQGFLTPSYTASTIDRYDADVYKIWIPKQGELKVGINASTGANPTIQLYDTNFNQIAIGSSGDGFETKAFVTNPGWCYIRVGGYAGDGSNYWYYNSYQLTPSFCEQPDLPTLSANQVSICDGQSAVLTAKSTNADNYYWFKDGQLIVAFDGIYKAASAGSYSVEARKNCGLGSVRSNAVSIAVSPTPTIPEAASVRYCQNAATVALSATGNGLKWYGSNLPGTGSVDAPKPATGQAGRQRFTVTQSANSCESQAREVFVDVDATPNIPAVTDLTACQNGVAPTLAATGTGLLWYSDATGGTGSGGSPVLSTSATGSQTVYVSQTLNRCEGPRAKLTMTIYPVPALPTAIAPTSVCRLATATALSAQGQAIRWYAQAEGGIGSNQSPVPKTEAAGVAAYFATQTINGCESARLRVEQPILPLPLAPVSQSARYCVGEATQPLSATGTQLRWYSQVTGGTSQTAAPVTTADRAKTDTYYVTQTDGNNCESLRQPVQVRVVGIPSAPVASTQYACQYAKPVALTATGENLVWKGSTLPASGSQTVTLTTDKPDTLRYTLTQQVEGCNSPSGAVTAIVRRAPESPAVASSLAYCIDSKAAPLAASGTGIRWYKQADRSGQATSTLLPATDQAGTLAFFATQTDANGCESLTSKTDVRIKPRPTATILGESSVYRFDSLKVSVSLTGDAPWQLTLWNNKPITVVQSPYMLFVKPLSDTTFSIKSVSNECGTGSNGPSLTVRVLTPLAVTQHDNFKLTALPNPTTTYLRIQWTTTKQPSVVVRLIGVNGTVIRSQREQSTGFEQTLDWDVSNIAAGLYVVQLIAEEGQLEQRVLKH